MIWTMAVIEAVPPTFISFLKLNSRPRLNSRKITPISAQTSTLLMSVMEGKKSKLFPAKKPATKYPKTRGCLIFLNNKTDTPAVIKINPKSLIKGYKWCEALVTVSAVSIGFFIGILRFV